MKSPSPTPDERGHTRRDADASPKRGRGIAQAATIVSLGNIASRVFGLIRDNRNFYYFGATGSMSAFEAASLVPRNMYELLVGGMVSAALVPVFSQYASKEESDELWDVLSVVLSLVVVSACGLLLLAEGAAPLLSKTLVGGFDAELQRLTTVLIRIISPAVIFFGVSGVLTAALYAQQVFAYPAIGAAVFNLGGILGTQLLARRIGISSLTFGIVFGAFLQMAVQVPGLRQARIRFSLNWRHPALRRIVTLYLPVVLSLVVSQIGIVVDRNLASRVGEQTIAWMASATRLREFPLGLVSTAVSMAVLPALSRIDLQTGRSEFKETLGLGLRLVLFLIIPAAVGLFVLAEPVIALIFQHGQFTALDTQQAARALSGYLLGTPFAAADLLLIFAFYSQKDTVTPVLVGIVCVLVFVTVAPTLAFGLGWGMIGLVVANSVQLTCHALIMFAVLHRRIGELEGEHLATSIAKILLGSVVMGAAVHLSLFVMRSAVPGPAILPRALRIAAAGLAGLITYGISMSVLRVSEARLLSNMLLRRAQNRHRAQEP